MVHIASLKVDQARSSQKPSLGYIVLILATLTLPKKISLMFPDAASVGHRHVSEFSFSICSNLFDFLL